MNRRTILRGVGLSALASTPALVGRDEFIASLPSYINANVHKEIAQRIAVIDTKTGRRVVGCLEVNGEENWVRTVVYTRLPLPSEKADGDFPIYNGVNYPDEDAIKKWQATIKTVEPPAENIFGHYRNKNFALTAVYDHDTDELKTQKVYGDFRIVRDSEAPPAPAVFYNFSPEMSKAVSRIQKRHLQTEDS